MKWTVREAESLSLFLQGKLENLSGKKVRKILEANFCKINGRVERFASKKLEKGDLIELKPDWSAVFEQKKGDIETLYENEAFKIINKPTGFVCEDLQVKKTFGENHYLVHRLDKDTTGLLILAKTSQGKDLLTQMFSEREIFKEYLALVDGEVKGDEGVRQSFLAKKGSFQGQTIWGSSNRGLMAITKWKKIGVGNKASFILLEPLTGRTHQIRVHMAEMGHPILVDRQYASHFRSPLFAKRPLLHAYRLQFSFAGEAIHVVAPLFVDIREALSRVHIQMGKMGQFFGQKGHDPCHDQSHDHKN